MRIFKVCSSPSMMVACYIDGRSCGQLECWRCFALTELFSALAMTTGEPRSSCEPQPRLLLLLSKMCRQISLRPNQMCQFQLLTSGSRPLNPRLVEGPAQMRSETVSGLPTNDYSKRANFHVIPSTPRAILVITPFLYTPGSPTQLCRSTPLISHENNSDFSSGTWAKRAF